MKFADAVFYFTGKKLVLNDGEILESRVSRMLFAGLSSSAALFVTHPLDVIKLNLQVKPMTMREVINYHYMKDKSVTRIYKGVSGSMARSMVYCNIRFELYELARRRNWLTNLYRKVAVASITGSIGGFFVTPMSKVHVRIQNDDLLAPNERRYYRGLFHGLYRIYRDEGPRALFSGSLVTALRGMMCTIGQIALYDEVKLFLLKYPQYFGDGFPMYLLSSVTAGFATTLLQQPFEVVSIIVLNTPASKFRSTGLVIRDTARLYGIAGFYKGLVPGFVRIVPQTVVTYMILENLRIRFGMIMKSRKRGEVVEVISIDDELVCDQSDEKCSLEVLAQEEEAQRKAREKEEMAQKKAKEEEEAAQKKAKEKEEAAQRKALEKEMMKKVEAKGKIGRTY